MIWGLGSQSIIFLGGNGTSGGVAKKKEVRSPDTCPHDSAPSYSLLGHSEMSLLVCHSLQHNALPCYKPLGSVVSDRRLRSLKLWVKYTDLFQITETVRIVLEDFHQNWFWSDCPVHYVPPQGSMMSLFILLLYPIQGRGFHDVFLLSTL